MLDADVDEAYIPVEEVALKLGLPLTVLLNRVEAGDVPARREETEFGPRYALRLSDLGIEPAEFAEFEIRGTVTELTVEPELEVEVESSSEVSEMAQASEEDEYDMEFRSVAVTGIEDFSVDGVAESKIAEPEDFSNIDSSSVVDFVPPPGRVSDPNLALFPYQPQGPRGEVANMNLDARELVAGLLDRWEKTLEQSIYAEQRRRFESELIARQNMVKQLQLELKASRAEHAAAQADKDRQLAEKERSLAERERELSDMKARVPKRRGWLFFR